jgi:hypothetical protein
VTLDSRSKRCAGVGVRGRAGSVDGSGREFSAQNALREGDGMKSPRPRM